MFFSKKEKFLIRLEEQRLFIKRKVNNPIGTGITHFVVLVKQINVWGLVLDTRGRNGVIAPPFMAAVSVLDRG